MASRTAAALRATSSLNFATMGQSLTTRKAKDELARLKIVVEDAHSQLDSTAAAEALYFFFFFLFLYFGRSWCCRTAIWLSCGLRGFTQGFRKLELENQAVGPDAGGGGNAFTLFSDWGLSGAVDGRLWFLCTVVPGRHFVVVGLRIFF